MSRSTRSTILSLVMSAGVVSLGCASSPPPRAPEAPPAVPVESDPYKPIMTEPNDATSSPVTYTSEQAPPLRTAGWIAIAVGASAGAVALGTSVMMLYDDGVRSDECPDKVCSRRGFSANSRLDEMGPWNAGAWALGVVGVAGGLFLVLTNPTRKSVVGVAPGTGGATLQGTF